MSHFLSQYVPNQRFNSLDSSGCPTANLLSDFLICGNPFANNLALSDSGIVIRGKVKRVGSLGVCGGRGRRCWICAGMEFSQTPILFCSGSEHHEHCEGSHPALHMSYSTRAVFRVLAVNVTYITVYYIHKMYRYSSLVS